MTTRSVAALAAAFAFIVAPAVASAADDTSRSMLDYAFSRASTQFYQPVTDQSLLNGAVTGMRTAVVHVHGDPNRLPSLHASNDAATDSGLLDHELALASKDFGKQITERDLSYAAISGMMDALHDRWTVFMDPTEFRGLNEGLDGGNFPGVGILIDLDKDTQSPLVIQTIDGGPAQRAGIQAGDIVTQVDGRTTKGLTTVQDSKLLRGKEGSTVVLTVLRKGEAEPM
ncbi:MAG TPA: PDZ domain-containing protein, partial [Candidatus Eremiobacteraceae bacterium]|nr:PDZ domain-containing protein [Candidatus Eremiobacteraceae bacterium]